MTEPMTYEAAADAMNKSAGIIRAKEKEYGEALDEAADAEALYRKSLADKYREYREAGKPVDESNTLARGDVFRLSRDRDRAIGKSRRIMEELENRRGERVSLHRLVEWSTAHYLIKVSPSTAEREDGSRVVPG